MLIAKSKVTRQGQISVPAEVRRDLGILPGSELIWDRQENGEYVIRPKRVTMADVHLIVGVPAVRLTDDELKRARQGFIDARLQRLKG